MFSHIQTNLHLKLKIYFKNQVTFLWAISQKSQGTLKIFVPLGHFSKQLRDIEDVCPSSQSATLRKKIVCTKKAYETEGVTSIWNMGASIFNWNDFYGLQKKYWSSYFLFSLLPASLKSTWIFYFWDIF